MEDFNFDLTFLSDALERFQDYLLTVDAGAVFSVLLTVFLILLLVGGLFALLFGILSMFHIFVRPKKLPMDESNRINHFRLWWFALTRPELFVNTFDWLKNDEFDNMRKD